MLDGRVNAIGIHSAIWDQPRTPEGWRAIAAGSRTAGFDLVEVLLVDSATIDVGVARAAFDEQGLPVVGTYGLTPAEDVSSDDAEVVAAGERALFDALGVAVDLGATYFGGVIYGALGAHRHPVSDRGRANSVSTVARVCERAAASGLQVGLELVNRYESNLLNTVAQAVDYLDEVGAANLVLELDTYHMNIEEPGIAAAIRSAGDRLGYFQVGESHRGYLGAGNVDFPAVFQALAEGGYGGAITVEAFSSAIGGPELQGVLSLWRDVWNDPTDFARCAAAFMQAGIGRGQA